MKSFIASDEQSIGCQSFGNGEPIIVVGGSLSTASSYAPLARLLADRFAVYVVDRRGRGTSGPQSASYEIAREVDDLATLMKVTDCTKIFGHSYGGLIALEAATQLPQLRDVVVYEPGVSINGSISGAWMPLARRFLDEGDTLSAFTAMARGAGFAPAVFTRAPFGFSKTMIRLNIRGEKWREIETHLRSQLAEHSEVVRLDDTYKNYSKVTANVFLMAGSKSPAFVKRDINSLKITIPGSTAVVLRGLDHEAPVKSGPKALAYAVLEFLTRG